MSCLSICIRDHAEQAIHLASDFQFCQFITLAKIFEGWALVFLGEGEAGIKQMHDAINVHRDSGARWGESFFLSLLAEAHEFVGQTQNALALVEEALATAKTHGEDFYAAETYRIKGVLLLTAGDATQAQECFQQALAIAHRQGAQCWALRASTSLAELWKDQDKRKSAYDLLSDVYAGFTEGFATADLNQAKLLLDSLAVP